jgi:hypothetical protein
MGVCVASRKKTCVKEKFDVTVDRYTNVCLKPSNTRLPGLMFTFFGLSGQPDSISGHPVKYEICVRPAAALRVAAPGRAARGMTHLRQFLVLFPRLLIEVNHDRPT